MENRKSINKFVNLFITSILQKQQVFRREFYELLIVYISALRKSNPVRYSHPVLLYYLKKFNLKLKLDP